MATACIVKVTVIVQYSELFHRAVGVRINLDNVMVSGILIFDVILAA